MIVISCERLSFIFLLEIARSITSKESRKQYLLHTFAREGKKAAVILNTSFGSIKIIRYY